MQANSKCILLRHEGKVKTTIKICVTPSFFIKPPQKNTHTHTLLTRHTRAFTKYE